MRSPKTLTKLYEQKLNHTYTIATSACDLIFIRILLEEMGINTNNFPTNVPMRIANGILAAETRSKSATRRSQYQFKMYKCDLALLYK